MDGNFSLGELSQITEFLRRGFKKVFKREEGGGSNQSKNVINAAKFIQQLLRMF